METYLDYKNPARAIDWPFDSFAALEPTLSEEACRIHYEEHHKGYERKAAELILEAGLGELSLPEIITISHQESSTRTLYENAAQVWNHNFYWLGLSPEPMDPPRDHPITEIFRRDIFLGEGQKHFASGWLWWVVSDQGFEAIATDNADTPILWDQNPLWCIDLWEHAYYLDYTSGRDEFLDRLLRLMNWDVVISRYEGY